MTNYITQSVARQQINDRIAQAEADRLRRQFQTFGGESRGSTPGFRSSVDRGRFPWARWLRLMPVR
jgi:hypothetical protein